MPGSAELVEEGIAVLPSSAVKENAKKVEAPIPSVLAEGEWFRFAVTEDGIFKIGIEELEAAGINASQINPKSLSIHGYGGGMLPQINSASKIADLPELAIYVAGEDDEKFDKEDYILFYAQGPDKVVLHEEEASFNIENNIYADSAFYYLSFRKSNGKRVIQSTNEGGGFSKITSFDALLYHEKEIYNLLSSGKTWFGERFLPGDQLKIDFEVPDIDPDSEIKLFVSAMSSNTSPSTFEVTINNQAAGEIALSPIPKVNFTTGDNLYEEKGMESEKWLNADPGSLTANLSIGLTFNANASEGFGYLNATAVNVKRLLKFRGQTILFQNLESLQNPLSTFQIENNVAQEVRIWDISDPLEPLEQDYAQSDKMIAFGAQTSSLKKYAVFSVETLPVPVFDQRIANQNIVAELNAELLIVSYPEFAEEAERLATFRRDHDNMEVAVVTPHQIYNEFSSGRQDVSAIRNYVKHLYDNGALKYLLLFGKCSFAYKEGMIIGDNTNFVPTYQSDNSLHPVETYSSDDFFGFLEEEEGRWREGIDADEHDLEIGIGRLPAKSTTDAKVIVDKIIHYSTNEKAFGAWRNEIVFVADDEDANTHQKDADKLATLVDTTHADYNINKIYLGAYPQEGKSSEAAQKALNDAIKKGALIVNYSGHGNENLWAEEKLLTIPMIEQWKNYDKLSFFVTATCDFGKYDDPGQVSGGESLMFSEKGGAIGMVTTSRPVYSNTNFLLNNALYNVIFNKEGTAPLRLGDIIRITKNNSIQGYRNRNFSLLGDPSLTLAFPDRQIKITAIESAASNQHQDTLKALSKMKIHGYIAGYDDVKLSSFNGVANVTIYDKPVISSTLPGNGAVMDYAEQNQVLFRGKVSIKSGEFTIELMVPKNIDYAYGNGKISIYAYDEALLLDAHTGFTEVVVGGSVPPVTVDNDPPAITLFMDDESFISGDVTGSNTTFIAQLSDESGININSNGLSQNIVATLNNEESFILNDFYESALDDYTEGSIAYPINNLEEGAYRLDFKVWDINSNFSERSIKFVVASNAKMALNSVLNFPNPFSDQTTFGFNHNRAGEDLEVVIFIYSLEGELIKELRTTIKNSSSRLQEIVWDGSNSSGGKLGNGVYVYKVVVQSLRDLAKSQQYNRLVIIN